MRGGLAGLAAVACAAAATAGAYDRDDLAAEVTGSIVFCRDAQVYTMDLGGAWDETVVAGCYGSFARWSPDGTKIAVWQAGGIYVVDPDGSNRQTFAGAVSTTGPPPIEFNVNGTEVIFTNNAIRAWDFSTTTTLRTIASYHKYDGEPGAAFGGKRICARDGHELYAITVGVGDRLYALGCSAGVSPDGARIMNNTDAHDSLALRDWDGSNISTILASSALAGQPESIWDNHHWSNHPDYIAIEGDGAGHYCYVLKVSTGEAALISAAGTCRSPDLWVANVISISGALTDGTGGPIAGARLTATPTVGAATSTITDDDGEYTIVGVLADGDYTITADGLSLSGTNPVAVAGGASVTGADFTAVAATDDGDGLPDWWELRHFGHLNEVDAGDPDGDGATNLAEFLAGTSPTTAAVSAGGGGGSGGCGAGGPSAPAWTVLIAAATALALRRRACRACRRGDSDPHGV